MTLLAISLRVLKNFFNFLAVSGRFMKTTAEQMLAVLLCLAFKLEFQGDTAMLCMVSEYS